MATLPGESLYLAGFALAHAAWSVSDTTPSELLCPLAIMERDGERRLVRFEAATQVEAIHAMQNAMTAARRSGEAFATAREGAWRPDGPDTETEDILTVEFWTQEMDEPVRVLQPFRRATDATAFMLLGDPLLLLDGAIIDRDDAAPAIDILLKGVQSHSAVRPLWKGWQAGRAL